MRRLKKYVDENGHVVWSTAKTREKFEFFEKLAKSVDVSFDKNFFKPPREKYKVSIIRRFESKYDLADYVYQNIHLIKEVDLIDFQIDFEHLSVQMSYSKKK